MDHYILNLQRLGPLATKRLNGQKAGHKWSSQLPQGATKTSGPPGTAEVSVAPAPETKKTSTKRNTTNKLISCTPSQKETVVVTTPPAPRRGKRRRWGIKQTRQNTLRCGQSLKGALMQRNISIPNQEKRPREIFIRNMSSTQTRDRDDSKKKTLGCLYKRGGGAHGPPLSSGKSSQGTRAPRVPRTPRSGNRPRNAKSNKHPRISLQTQKTPWIKTQSNKRTPLGNHCSWKYCGC